MKITISYTKAVIMTQAHKFYADGRMGDWSACLRKAWENAKTIKTTLEGVGEEAKTYSGWVKAGFEVVHGQHTVVQCVINSIRYASKTTEILSFFTKSQVCVLGTQ